MENKAKTQGLNESQKPSALLFLRIFFRAAETPRLKLILFL